MVFICRHFLLNLDCNDLNDIKLNDVNFLFLSFLMKLLFLLLALSYEFSFLSGFSSWLEFVGQMFLSAQTTDSNLFLVF